MVGDPWLDRPRLRGDAHGQNLPYNPAFDGLRAFAVLAVMLYHGQVDVFGGGFLGVDVFFVLSGFLITSLLAREWLTWGRIDMLGFWARRARRLLPAAWLVLLACAAYGVLFASADRLAQLRSDAIATFFYVVNWHFITSGQSYFAQYGEPSPLRHMWSLAIEEQFYFLWPMVLTLLLPMILRRRRIGVAVMVTAAVLSAVLMALLYEPGADPSRVYYGTDTRAQALLVGAGLAILLDFKGTRRDRGTTHLQVGAFTLPIGGLTVAGPVALVGLLVALSMSRESSTWLYRGGFLAVALLSATVIAAAATRGSLLSRLLSLRPLQAVGLISYGLYLWHWPVDVVLTTDRTGLSGAALLAVQFAVTFALAVASYILVERPIRAGALLRRGPRVRLVAVATAAVTVLAATVAATAGASPIPSSPDGSSSTRVVAGIDGAEHILVAGDSVAWSLAYPFDQKAHPEVAVSSTTIFGCGVGVQQIVVDDVVTQRQEQCDTWPDTWRKAVEDVKPDVSVLVVSAWDIYDHEVDGQHLTVGSSAYSDYLLGRLGRAVDTLGAGGRPVVVVNSGCYDQESFSIQGVDLAPDRNNASRAQAVNAVVRRLAALRPGQVSVADLFSLTCRNGHYSRSLSGTELRSDGVHFTTDGAREVWDWLLPQLRAHVGETSDQRLTGR